MSTVQPHASFWRVDAHKQPNNMGGYNSMDNTYPEGSVVFARVRPTVALVIRRYIDRIYYCRSQVDPLEKEQVYFERELLPLKELNK